MLKTYAALEGTTIDVVAVQLANGHGGILMRVHFDKRESTVGLQTGLNHVAEVLEEWDEIGLRGVRGQVTHIARGLPLWGLLDDHVVALDAVGREMVMTEGRGRRHPHGGHGLLLGNGRLTLLVGPVATNSAGAEPLPIHRTQSLVGVRALAESNKAIATGPASLHIPHNTSLGYRAKGRESLEKHLIVDFIAQISDENVEVVRRILLVCAVRLVGPVHTNFLQRSSEAVRYYAYVRGLAYRLVDATSVERLHGPLGGARVVEFDEAVVVSFTVELL